MEVGKIKKYLQVYLDEVITPKINDELVGEDDEPIKISIHKINFGEANPNRINFFLDMEPDWSKGSYTNKINSDILKLKKLPYADYVIYAAILKNYQKVYIAFSNYLSLAKKYHVTVDDINNQNEKALKNGLQAGQVLTIKVN
jgi:hypothetical protein